MKETAPSHIISRVEFSQNIDSLVKSEKCKNAISQRFSTYLILRSFSRNTATHFRNQLIYLFVEFGQFSKKYNAYVQKLWHPRKCKCLGCRKLLEIFSRFK